MGRLTAPTLVMVADSPRSGPPGISIGVKIFGIATSLLGLLVLVVYVSTDRLRQVNVEITDLAEYIIPITDRVAQVDVHALEQELHFERVQRLYEVEPLEQAPIQAELKAFEERGTRVNAELAAAIALAKTALTEAQLPQEREEWGRIEPMLETIEIEHQQFHDHAVVLFTLLAKGDRVTARRLEDQLIAEETDFNQAINAIFLELEAFTVNAAQAGQRHQQTVQSLSLAVAAAATIFGLIYATLVTMGLVRPVRSLAQGIAAVQAGDLDTHLDISSRDEVGTLAQSFNAMVNELKLKARLEDTFGKYVDPRIIQTLIQAPETATSTAGERQVMTVFFAGVEGFEAAIATLDPDQQVQLTNVYLSLMSAPISTHDGVIDKFIGPVMMGFWGPPFTAASGHAQLACEAALAQIQCLGQLRQAIAEMSVEPVDLQLHVGLSTGSLVVGNMGSATAKSYTVMGDTVNIASRLKGASQQYGVAILLSEATQQQVSATLATRELDLIQVVGKAEPLRIYELLGPQDTLSAVQKQVQAAFAEGLTAYRHQDWPTARTCFETCLEHQPGDRPSQLYLDRIATFLASPPTADWSGVWQLTHK